MVQDFLLGSLSVKLTKVSQKNRGEGFVLFNNKYSVGGIILTIVILCLVFTRFKINHMNYNFLNIRLR